MDEPALLVNEGLWIDSSRCSFYVGRCRYAGKRVRVYSHVPLRVIWLGMGQCRWLADLVDGIRWLWALNVPSIGLSAGDNPLVLGLTA